MQEPALNIPVLNVSPVPAFYQLLENFLEDVESIFSIYNVEIHSVLQFPRTTSLWIVKQGCLLEGRLNLLIHNQNRDLTALPELEEKPIAPTDRMLLQESGPETQTEIERFIERKSACPGHWGWRKWTKTSLVFPWLLQQENGEQKLIHMLLTKPVTLILIPIIPAQYQGVQQIREDAAFLDHLLKSFIPSDTLS